MTKPRPLTAIVAATLDNGIGRDGGLPWRLPGEIKYFARVTTGEPSGGRNAVLMGRRTWDGIPPKFRPLKDRYNLVISRTPQVVEKANLTTAHASFEDALASVPGDTHRVFLIGGATLYNAALPSHVDRVLLTRVLERLPCDVFLSDFTALPGWRLTSHDELRQWVGWEVPEGEVEEKGIRYRYEMWVKE
ncbi:hypothetical protein CcaverHIS002_0404740 [Cutaneotrichosporon cavernicola]|uniref:Dihydrofolate reductase n=1 Tax=Cutaneotrichosporon cavernicola TaxID=279322 RepID=A0AA48QVU0_9TREE|nr:uncharacterized protein CcaverHIS019_0404710 [Cutaneotrichosporon cavernicola]BEI83870.1 hypothetical protein CcaverHIS002_0404740 [Cutaneotrichosporon cavernicola]BEI91651.1 hypothetical protein CcaverHIS019_0404710 [Cutaneotrichosporon cavernicola]BEI99426.1 hypothetical protein CcaverHIS631_0404690 [Cutaneotrichosporon cavernicola]BEJ07204.1 hypothetical protein CcaverHIS641_0404730 [Cutaneotrichosporon cavernicola]